MKTNKTKKEISYFWLIFVLIAFVILIEESFSLYKDTKAQNWPTVIGNLSTLYTPQGIGHVDPLFGPIFEPFRRRHISFSYEINDIWYRSANESFGFAFNEKVILLNGSTAEQPKVKVYFNPQDPSEAILIPGPKISSIALMVLSLIILFVSIRQFKQN